MKSIYGVLLCAGLLAMASCKKDGSVNAQDEALTGGTWKLQKLQYLENGIWVDDTDPQDVGVITFEFHADNSFVGIDDGNSVAGTWSLSDNCSQLTVATLVDGSSDAKTSPVDVLTPSSLIVENSGVRDVFVHGGIDI